MVKENLFTIIKSQLSVVNQGRSGKVCSLFCVSNFNIQYVGLKLKFQALVSSYIIKNLSKSTHTESEVDWYFVLIAIKDLNNKSNLSTLSPKRGKCAQFWGKCAYVEGIGRRGKCASSLQRLLALSKLHKSKDLRILETRVKL